MNNNPNRYESRMEKSMKKTMTTWTRRVTLGAFITMNLALGVQAAEPPKVTPSNDPKVSSATQWTLTGDGKNWKGTYKGQYGSAWTGSGKIGAATIPADGKLSPHEGVR